MQAKKARAAAHSAPQTSEQDDPIPENIDDFRNELARRINRLVSNEKHRWSTCRERSCKRGRQCFAPHGRCSNREPLPPMTAEQTARHMAKLQRMIQEQFERNEADRTSHQAGSNPSKIVN